MRRSSCWFLSAIVLVLSISFSARAEEYWQQEVNYRIDVKMQSDLRTIEGTCRIQYINNSPDTLRELYIKTFPNAVQPGSYMDRKQRKTGDYSFANLKPEQQGTMQISGAVEYGRRGGWATPFCIPKLDNTVARLYFDNIGISYRIDAAIIPHDTVNLLLPFKTVLPSPHAARMGLINGVAKAAYWYPQVCVYDRRLGWNNGQYLGWGECYGDYGTFEVNIEAPEDIIIAATGDLTNESEVLPDSLKAMLQLDNFLKPSTQWPTFQFSDTTYKTWRFVAKNVNDFAFVASRDYCFEERETGGVRVIAYALRSNAKRWQSAAEDGAKAIETFSQLYIPYQWPVMRICDAFAGMEFPMLVHCSGGPPSPGWYVVVWHEIAHNWFMGMIGSNQTDRPFLDEGFTTHAEHVIVEKYRGRYINGNYARTWYERTFAPDDEDRDSRGFRPLLLLMNQGYDKPMVFSYDQGEEYWPYRVSAYYKCAAMHYSLRSILGDSAYFKAMQDYCRTWVFKHPYEEDFVESMEASTGLELNSFFQQWYDGRQRLDYAYDGMTSKSGAGANAYTIKLKNLGRFVSPVDVAVVYDNHDTSYYTASPEEMAYTKPGYTQLATWNQFRRFDNEYQFTISSPHKIRKVIVDPQNLLMDINRLNNQSGLVPPVEIRFDNMKFDRAPVNQYALRWRPDIWYDEPNGVQLGMHLHGSYLETESKFRVDSRVGTNSGLPLLDVQGRLPFRTWGPGPEFSQRLLLADHRLFSRTSYFGQLKKLWSRPDRTFFGVNLDLLDVEESQKTRLSPVPDKLRSFLPDATWDAGSSYIATITSGGIWTFHYGDFSLVSTTSLGGHSYGEGDRGFQESQTQATLHLAHNERPLLTSSLEYLTTGGEPPSHRVNHLSRVTSIERFTESQVFRSPGTFPPDWENNFYLSTARVRGYQDRAVYFLRSFSGSIEVTPLQSLPIPLLVKVPVIGRLLAKANTSLFLDAASISMKGKEHLYREPIANNESLTYNGNQVFASAGFSVTTPPIWSQQRLRLDFPFYLSKPAPRDEKVKFRFSVAWIIPELY